MQAVFICNQILAANLILGFSCVCFRIIPEIVSAPWLIAIASCCVNQSRSCSILRQVIGNWFRSVALHKIQFVICLLCWFVPALILLRDQGMIKRLSKEMSSAWGGYKYLRIQSKNWFHMKKKIFGQWLILASNLQIIKTLLVTLKWS